MKLSKTKLLCLVFTAIVAALSLFGCGKEQQSGPPQYDGFDFYIRTAQLDKSYVFVAEKALEISDGTSTVYVNGLFDEGFAVYNGEIYAYNTELSELWRISADGSHTVAVTSDKFSVAKTALMKYGDEKTYRSVAGAYEKYIYFNENFSPDYGFTFVLDTQTGSYTKTNFADAELCYGLNGKIYYMSARGMYSTDTLYECDVLLTESKKLLTDVLHYGFVGETVYYVHVPDDLYDIDSPAFLKGYQISNFAGFDLNEVTTHKTVFADFGYANMGAHAESGEHIAVIRNYIGGEFYVEAVNCSLRDGCIFTQEFIPDSTAMECRYITADKIYTFLCDTKVMYRLHFENGTVYYTDDDGKRIYPETVITDTVFDSTSKTPIVKYGVGE